MTIIERPSRMRAAALIAAIAATLASCSSSGTKSAGGGAGEAEGRDPNGVIKIGYDLVQQASGSLIGDPATAPPQAGAADALYYLVYGRFVRKNADGSFTPQLAKSATIVDSHTIEIVLREGETFSDGTPFDGAAVKAGLERSAASKNEALLKPQFFSLKSVDLVSPTEVRLNFPDGTAGSWYDAYIASFETTITKPGETNPAKPIGAGPMMVTSYAPGQKVVLARNPRFFDADAVKVAGMEFIHVSGASPQSGTAGLRSRQLDVVYTEPSQLSSLSGDLEPYSRVSPDETISLHLCKRSGPLAEARVRIALNKAIDRDALNEAIFHGTAAPATQLWPTGHTFNDPALDTFLAYDPAQAKKLLKEAGYAQGFSVDLYPIAFGGISETAVALKQQLGQVGINVNIMSSANYVNDFLTPRRDGIGIYPGGSLGVQKLNAWSGDSIGNVCQYDDPKITSLLRQLSSVSQTDPKAKELWHEAEELVVGQALGGFVLFRSSLAAYNAARLGDMSTLQLGQFVVPDPTKTYVKAG